MKYLHPTHLRSVGLLLLRRRLLSISISMEFFFLALQFLLLSHCIALCVCVWLVLQSKQKQWQRKWTHDRVHGLCVCVFFHFVWLYFGFIWFITNDVNAYAHVYLLVCCAKHCNVSTLVALVCECECFVLLRLLELEVNIKIAKQANETNERTNE